MRPRQWVLILTGSLGPLLLAVVWFEVQLSRATRPAGPQTAPDGPTAVFYNHTERLRGRRGEVQWQLEADRVEVMLSGDYAVHHLRHGQYFADGVAQVHLRADRARIEARTRNIAAYGRVRAVSGFGLRFQTEAAYWFETGRRLVVPEVEELTWHDPEKPDAEPARLRTRRLFFWPDEGRLELPEAVSGDHLDHHLQAARAGALLEDGRLRLGGPAEVDVMVSLDEVTGDRAKLLKRLVAMVGKNGEIAYNARTGGMVLDREVSVDIPADKLNLRCDHVVYSGDEKRLVKAEGHLQVTSPDNSLAAPRAVVDTVARRADLTGSVTLVHRDPAAKDGPVEVTAPRLSLWYAAGHRRAEAKGGVHLVSGQGTATAPQADVDLERKLALLTGDVVLRHTPRGKAPPGADRVEQAKFQPAWVTCRRLVHAFAGPRWSELTGSPHFHQRDKEATATRMWYDHDRELLQLEGDVRAWTKEGERARCVRLTYDLGRDEMAIETPAEAEFFLPDEAS